MRIDLLLSVLPVMGYGMLGIFIVTGIIIGCVTVLGFNIWKHVYPLSFMEQLNDKNIFDSLDFISNSILMPIGAVFTTLLIVAIVGLKKVCQEVQSPGKKWYREYNYRFCMIFIVIPCLLIILLNTTGILK
jgi:NSS family neurotransmitter:Na+ symporter